MFATPEFWVLVAFVIFAVAVWKPAARAVTAALDGHAQRVKAEIEEARRLREEAQRLLADYQKRQREALAEAEEIVTHAKAEAERLRREGAASLVEQIERRRQLALEKIAQAEAQAVAEVRAAAVSVAIEAARTLIGETLDPAKADALVEGAIRELPRRLH